MAIIAYHAIFTTYGTWLPNDPRGSYSRQTYMRELRGLGEIRYGRQNPQPPLVHLRLFWTASRGSLSRAPCFIDDAVRPIVTGAFARVVDRLGLAIRACAIMNDHVHILVEKSSYKIEYVVAQLKGAATHDLALKKTLWSRGCWKVFIDDEAALRSARQYIESNPSQARMNRQVWSFVTSE